VGAAFGTGTGGEDAVSFRRKLLVAFTAIVVIALGVVAVLTSWRTRRVFEREHESRTTAVVQQFEKMFTQRQQEMIARVKKVAESDAVAHIASDVGRGGDPAPYVNDARALADTNDLDFLEIVANDGSIISSAQYAARFGYKDAAVEEAREHDTTILRPEELPDGTALGVFYVTRTGAPEKPLFVVGGARVDQQFLSSFALPPGMRVLLYGSAAPAFDRNALISPSGAIQEPDKLAPLIQEGLRRDSFDAPVYWTRNIADSERFHTMRLVNEAKAPIGVLMVGTSRRDMVDLQRQLRVIAIFVAGVGILVAVVLSGWIAARFTRPVEALALAARDVGRGHWDTHVEVKSRDEFGELAGAFNTMTRELVEQREKLVQTERVAAWRELARRLAHELKNPLFPLQITVENLARSRQLSAAEVDEVFNESTATLLAEIANLKAIIGRFSDFSKMPRPQLQRADVNDIARQVLKLHEAQLRGAAKPVEPVLELDPALPATDVDPELLHRVLANLVLNSMDAMPDGGKVTVRTRVHADHVIVEVSDTGVGLTPEEGERLFTPYYTTKRHGTGLGLAIAQSVIADHHGTITVDSTPGKGTTFRIELPVRQPEQLNAERGSMTSALQ
jgi:two-component system, NtrC family, nitrogen regulation sensor histidine kinase NtrY